MFFRITPPPPLPPPPAPQRVNKMKPIWMRNPREVKDEEYAEFYKSTFKAWDEVAAQTHFSLEGQVEFRALLFVPSVLPYELSRNMFDETSRNVRLYVKRVFINDKFEELLPRWLMFLRGVVSVGGRFRCLVCCVFFARGVGGSAYGSGASLPR